MLKKSFLMLLLSALLVFAIGTLYPDGPFKVMVNYEGHAITTAGNITIHSHTRAVEYHVAGHYTKSVGTTSYSEISFTTSSANALLDAWFAQGSGAPQKNIYLTVLNGNNQVTEGWKIYSAKPISSVAKGDGTVEYTVAVTGSFERDHDIAPPV